MCKSPRCVRQLQDARKIKSSFFQEHSAASHFRLNCYRFPKFHPPRTVSKLTSVSTHNQSLVRATLAVKFFSVSTPWRDTIVPEPERFATRALLPSVAAQHSVRALSFPPHKAVQSGAQTTPPVCSQPTLRENLDAHVPSNQPGSDHCGFWPAIRTRSSHRFEVCPGSFSKIPPAPPATGSPAIQKAHSRRAGRMSRDNLAGFCLSHPGPNIESGSRRLAGSYPAANLLGSNDTLVSITRQPVPPNSPSSCGSVPPQLESARRAPEAKSF